MKAYKGFTKDLRSDKFGYQYEDGRKYITDEAICCSTGFHSYLYPLEVFEHYNPLDSIYYEVDVGGKIDKHSDHYSLIIDPISSIIASTEITLVKKLSLQDIIKETFQTSIKNIDKIKDPLSKYCLEMKDSRIASTTDDKGISLANGMQSIAGSTGNKSLCFVKHDTGITSSTGRCSLSLCYGAHSVSSSVGNKSVSSTNGIYSISASSGHKSFSLANNCYSIAATTGSFGKSRCDSKNSAAISTSYDSQTLTTEEHSISGSTGLSDNACSSSIGYSSVSVITGSGSAKTSGDFSVAVETGGHTNSRAIANGFGNVAVVNSTRCAGSVAVAGNSTSIAIGWSRDARVKGVLGSTLVLGDWRLDKETDEWTFYGAKMLVVDGDTIKPDTYYYMVDGEIKSGACCHMTVCKNKVKNKEIK